MTVIDLFAGCGGFSLGFSQAGFNVRTAVEFDPDIAETYRKNHADTHVIVSDVRNVDIFQKGDSDIIIGGPPCQGFSMAGARIRTGFVDDPRNYLFRRYIEIVSAVRPRMFVIENVKGLCTFRNGAVLNEIMERFSALSPPYYVYPRLVNTQDFGIPQKRERLLLIGTLRPIEDIDALWAWTRAELVVEDAHCFDSVSVWDAIGNLPPAVWDRTVSNPAPQSRYQHSLATADTVLHNHTRSRHSALAVDRMCRVGNGQDASALNEPINSIYGGAYGRLCWDRPAPTITTRFDTPAAGRFTHPDENRTLTPREAARIQSFPDDYVFYGKRTSVCRQIGNAVPPKISYFLARFARTVLSADSSNTLYRWNDRGACHT
jgi:DNA (cytosine-5)-methyltransferase 1